MSKTNVSKMDKQTRYEFHLGRYREYAGAATGELFAIWTDQLWENEYDSFDEFLKIEVTDFSRSRVYALLKAESVKRLPGVLKLDTSKLKTSHFEEVAKVQDDKEKVEILKEALEESNETGKPITTSTIKRSVKERLPEPSTNGDSKSKNSTPTEPEREVGDEPPEMTAEQVRDRLRKERAGFIATLDHLQRQIDVFKKHAVDDASYKRFKAGYDEAWYAIKGWKIK